MKANGTWVESMYEMRVKWSVRIGRSAGELGLGNGVSATTTNKHASWGSLAIF